MSPVLRIGTDRKVGEVASDVEVALVGWDVGALLLEASLGHIV